MQATLLEVPMIGRSRYMSGLTSGQLLFYISTLSVKSSLHRNFYVDDLTLGCRKNLIFIECCILVELDRMEFRSMSSRGAGGSTVHFRSLAATQCSLTSIRTSHRASIADSS